MPGRKEWCGGYCGTTFTAKHWLTLDVCGLLGVSCSASIHILAFFVLVQYVVLFSTNPTNEEMDDKMDNSSNSSNSSSNLQVILSTLVFYGLYGPATVLALISLYQATTTNPGAVPFGARPFTRVTQLPSTSSSTSSSKSTSPSLQHDCDVLSSPSSTTALVAIPNQHSNSNGASVPNLPFESPQPTSLTTIPLGDANDNTLTPPPPPPLQTLPLAHASVSSTSSSSTSQQRAIRRCPKCNDNFKPPRAHHDSVTGRCVVKFDHYCPWINNAVGALNHKLFCLFLLYTALTCVAVWLLLGVRIWQCASSESVTATASAAATSANYAEPVVQDVWDGGVLLRRLSSANSSPSNASPHDYIRHFPAVLFPEQCQDFVLNSWVRSLCLASIVFFIFTTVMGIEQVEAIRSGQGKIARLKQSVGAAGSTELSRVTTEFNEMFGGSTPYVTWHWFLPVPVRFVSSSMRQVVLGYEYDASFAVTTTTTTGCVENGMDDGDNAFGANASIRSTDGLLRLDAAAENGPNTNGATFPTTALPGRSSLEFTPRESSDGTTSTGSIKNRRHGNHSFPPNASFLGDMEGSGISLVERTKTRLS